MDISFQQECPVAVDKTTGEITRAAAKMKEYFLVRQQKEHIRLFFFSNSFFSYLVIILTKHYSP